MPFSMTGFGHGEALAWGRHVNCDIKTVNNRYCDIQLHLPKQLSSLDVQLRGLCRDLIKRGKVDINITIQDDREDNRRVFCDIPLAEAYKAALEELGAVLDRPYLVNVRELATFDGVLKFEEAGLDSSEWLPLLEEAISCALDDLVAMRAREGNHLAADILLRLNTMQEHLRMVKLRAPQVIEMYRDRLARRYQELLGADWNNLIEAQRLEAELVLWADKAGIDEELARLDSHIKAFALVINEDDAIGKKLDFIVQEMNREINTIGSKANDSELSSLVIELKTELEKIREQIQNLE